MPPKAKFTEAEIIDAALEIVRKNGFSSLTARALGAELGSSARPVFTVFRSMEEVQQAVINKAKSLYSSYIDKGLSMPKAFKGVGTQYILFSIKEPKLFQLLFMREQKQISGITEILPIIDDNYEKILSSINSDYGIQGECAQKLYRHMWIYTHGIATLCATHMCRFTPEEISEMISEAAICLLKGMRQEQ